MAEEENKEEGKGKASGGKKSLGGLLLMLFILVNLGTLGAGAYFVYQNTIGYEKVVTSEEMAKRELASFEERLAEGPVMFTMDPFNTNLEGVPRRLIRLQMSLEMLDAQGFEEVVGLGAQARDRVVQILNQKQFDDVETVQGKLHLKNQIIAQINSFLDKGVVQNVYFSDFVIQ